MASNGGRNSLANSLANMLGSSLAGGGAGSVPSAVNAGPDASHNRFYGAAYQLAGSASGATSYAWTKVSGTPVPTFTDATNPTTTVTFNVAGAVVLRLTATNASGSASDDVTITVTATGALDGLATAPSALRCPGVNLLSSYSGVAFRVRRASDNAETNINYTANNVADLAALALHCAGTDGFLVTTRDVSGNSRDVTNATAAQQHKIYDSVTGPLLVNGYLYALGAGSNDYQARADNSGVSGTTAKSVMWCGRPSAAAAGYVSFIGVAGAGQAIMLYSGATATVIGCQGGSTSYREFTSTDYTAANQRWVLRLQNAGTQGQMKVRQNGAELVEVGSLNPATASNTAAGVTQSFGRSVSAANGIHCAEGIWAATSISDADADLCNTALQAFFG